MDAPEETATCAGCGALRPRRDMFGAAPDLLCEACADRIRARYDTSLRAPRARWKAPVVTSLVAAVAILLFVAVHLLRIDKTWVWRLEQNARIWSGEVWRLVTSAFLHAGPHFHASLGMGLLHVGFNVWWCYDLGRAIEGRWGHLALLALVLGGAAASGALQWMADGAGVGLSGVLYALAGFLFALRKVDPVAAAVMNPRTANALIAWFVVCIVLTRTGTLGVANWAHGGGAAWGWLAGLAVRARRRRLAVPLLALATAVLVAVTPFLAFGDQARNRKAWRLWKATRVSDTRSPYRDA